MSAGPVETRTARAWLEGHLITVEVRPGAQVTLEDAKEHLEAGRELAAGLSYTLLLIDMGTIRSINREARVHYRAGSGPDDVENRALAIVVGSPLARTVANFFIGLNRPAIPVRLFTDVGEARSWLEGFDG